jgi:hypothetical protein
MLPKGIYTFNTIPIKRDEKERVEFKYDIFDTL